MLNDSRLSESLAESLRRGVQPRHMRGTLWEMMRRAYLLGQADALRDDYAKPYQAAAPGHSAAQEPR